jgi:hypothetical protein
MSEQDLETVNEEEDVNEEENTEVQEEEQEQESNCPVCNSQMRLSDLMPHMMVHHPTIFMLWASYTLPYTTMNYSDDEDDIDWTHDYTYLSNLCDTIGYHKVGISNIDEVAPIVSENHKSLNENCPICMELLHKNDDDPNVRVTISCKHGFCASCLEKWLSENKTCPVCIQWLPKEETQPSVLEEVD